jgi:hypothetical protein
MGERERRVGLNEAAFRAVNDQIESLSERFSLRADVLELVCECGNASCAERLPISHDEYRSVRADSRRFVVVPGHEMEDTEFIVDEKGEYFVVQKREGEGAEIARATDVTA